MSGLNRTFIRVGMACAGWLCGFAGVRGVGEVNAEPIRQFSVEYVGAAGCPSQSLFVSGVEGRTALARFVPAAREVRVSLEIRRSDGEAFTGVLRIDGEVKAPSRELTGDRCEELVAAAALIVALAIDPEATAEPRPPSNMPAVAPEPEPTQPKPTAPRPAPAPRDASDASELGFAFSAALGVTSGVGSGVTPLGSVTGKLRGTVAASWDAALWLRGGYARGKADGRGGSVDLSLLAAQVGVSPYVWARHAWVIEPSLTFDSGRLQAEARDVSHATSDSAPWLGPGVELMVGRELFELGHGALNLELRAGALWSLSRDYFYFRKDLSGGEDRVFQQPRVVGRGAFALEYAW